MNVNLSTVLSARSSQHSEVRRHGAVRRADVSASCLQVSDTRQAAESRPWLLCSDLHIFAAIVARETP